MRNYTGIFLREIVGYGRLSELIDSGRLEKLVRLNRQDKVSSAISGHLSGLLHTIRCDVDETTGPNYLEHIEVPRVLPIIDLLNADFSSSEETGDDYDPVKTSDLTGSTVTRESGAFYRAASDGDIEETALTDIGIEESYGISSRATHTLGSFDQMFTSGKFFTGRELAPDRVQKAERYLRHLLAKAGFEKGSYRTEVIRKPDPQNTDRIEQVLILNTADGLSLVFRDERGIENPSEPDPKRKPPGTAIYFDGGLVDTENINNIVKEYDRITGVKRGGKRD